MIGRHAAILFFRYGVPAVLIALAISRDGVVSVQLLLGSAAVWIAGTMLWDFVSTPQKHLPRAVAAWRTLRDRSSNPRNPRGVQAINILVTNSLNHSRAHETNLRPRLIELAEHYFPIRHGFELHGNDARAAAVLGDVAWLIDPLADERTPTVGEIDQFLDRILDEGQHREGAR